MMHSPFDLAAFRQHMECDAETEQLLLRLFLDACDASLAVLHAHAPTMPDATADSVWKEQMHLIRGAAVTLGAAELVALTTQGELLATGALRGEKFQHLAAIEKSCEELRHFIHTLLI